MLCHEQVSFLGLVRITTSCKQIMRSQRCLESRLKQSGDEKVRCSRHHYEDFWTQLLFIHSLIYTGLFFSGTYQFFVNFGYQSRRSHLLTHSLTHILAEPSTHSLKHSYYISFIQSFTFLFFQEHTNCSRISDTNQQNNSLTHILP